MEAQTENILQLLWFAIELMIFYLPCTLGSIVSFLTKKELYKNDPKLKKKAKSMKLRSCFVTSIIPAVIMTMLGNTSLFNDMNPVYKYGIAFFLGIIGIDITAFSMSLKNILMLIKAFLNGAEGIKALTDKITEAEKSNSKDDERDNDDDDKN